MKLILRVFVLVFMCAQVFSAPNKIRGLNSLNVLDGPRQPNLSPLAKPFILINASHFGPCECDSCRSGKDELAFCAQYKVTESYPAKKSLQKLHQILSSKGFSQFKAKAGDPLDLGTWRHGEDADGEMKQCIWTYDDVFENQKENSRIEIELMYFDEVSRKGCGEKPEGSGITVLVMGRKLEH